jgi:hypothetical protein
MWAHVHIKVERRLVHVFVAVEAQVADAFERPRRDDWEGRDVDCCELLPEGGLALEETGIQKTQEGRRSEFSYQYMGFPTEGELLQELDMGKKHFGDLLRRSGQGDQQPLSGVHVVEMQTSISKRPAR